MGRRPIAAAVTALLAAALALAACSSSSKSSSSVAAGAPAAAGSSGSTATSGTSGSAAATVLTKSTSAGMVLTDAAGLPLYTYDKDQAGATTSACTGGCASIWPPVIASGTPTAGPGVTGTLATLSSGQVTWNGHPLYTFASDKAGGNPTGDGVGGFHVALAGGAATTATSKASSGYGY